MRGLHRPWGHPGGPLQPFSLPSPPPNSPPGWSPQRSARLSSPTLMGSTSRPPQGCQVGLGGTDRGGRVAGCWLVILTALPTAPPDPLLCKFADGGQKKRQSQGKFVPNGRAWARDSDTVNGA